MSTKAKKKPITATGDSLIYVGPTIEHGRLSQYTILKNGIPTHVQDLVSGNADIAQLIVPVQHLTSTKQAVQKQGTPENAAYARLIKGV
ncbi:hypothetical protein HZF08_33615 [Paenibacillus sp. CGMCC 1.16610]|uniref:Uncharacterized protein n=1 Tax=Paenibacillus anseongense TaxID=2682845 RepID=A0ABW9U118_9BACL|nr:MULTISPECIES: hypothetical protein [Paenibacillus]MBA2943211.1 hypothetical protein [Paenibacillus sp. CGMCC 1.16610]MVQ33708.1 hypothetical protein [Paenibacillus anseongense]